MKLARVDDRQEDRMLHSKIHYRGHYGPYIGMDDIAREGHWQSGDHCKIIYLNWNRGEPNGRRKENCAQYWRGGRWNDISCRSKHEYFCEQWTTPPRGHCPTNNVHFTWRGTDYIYVKELATFKRAEAGCRSHGMKLARIDNAAENNFLHSKISYRGNSGPFIGLDDRKREGRFAWSDGCPLTYKNWQRREPNNLRNEDCVQFWMKRGKWNDIHCNSRHEYICERYSSLGCGGHGHGHGSTDISRFSWKGQKYIYGHSRRTYKEAEADCQAHGMNLVRIDNAEENHLINTVISYRGHSGPFIGLNDRWSEGHYVWSDGCPMKYKNWHHKEPNNAGNEDCAQFWMGRGKWNDISCHSKQEYICEKYPAGHCGEDSCTCPAPTVKKICKKSLGIEVWRNK